MARKRTIATVEIADKAAMDLSAPQKTAAKKAIPVAKKKASPKNDTVKKNNSIKMSKDEIDTSIIKATSPKASINKHLRKIIFQLRFNTSYGQELMISGNHPSLGNGIAEKAIPLQYFNEDYWYYTLELTEDLLKEAEIHYHYILKNADGTLNYDWGNDKSFSPSTMTTDELLIIDSWNYAGYFENSFYTEPFQQVLLKAGHAKPQINPNKKFTHTIKVKAPLVNGAQTICLSGNVEELGKWDTKSPLLLEKKEGKEYYEISLDLSGVTFPIAYKFGVFDTEGNTFLQFEAGNNRVLFDSGKDNRQTIVNEGFAVLPNNTWKGAGSAIPVFSLRTEKGFGCGEFADIALLVDWSKKVGMKMVQILPVNDTTATHTWMDSYPYAAISAFALHPMYLNLEKLSDTTKALKKLQKLESERTRLNALPVVDYEVVNKIKTEFALLVYKESGESCFETADFKDFFKANKHWLVPYAAFCYLRDQYGTVDFNKWPAYKHFNEKDIEELTEKGSTALVDIGLYYFIQYHLHLQLKEASAYAHANGIILKGDIAIGVYRHGADAWQNPELYHLDYQAGAPPDDFAIHGQNWGFPTYNWQRMREDGFAWWKQRFEQMGHYFDAFRIDHILGFFRIWSIPMHAVEGILGHFVPAIPVHINEFNSQGIWFDHHRYTQPFISENVLWEIFGYDNELVKSLFLKHVGNGIYALKPAYQTQRQVEEHFSTLEQDEHHAKIKQGLFDLISNVILFEAEGNDHQNFHFRFGMEQTSSFRNLEQGTQQQLKELYVNYFFRRQDDFWMKEALQKLPALKRETNMLVCGEDLGLVPSCVPDVMRQLGLLSLEIQRMPKDPSVEFFHPNDAPYLSVVTPSTHDMSTIRGWWEEDREKIQRFYNNVLGQWGDAPQYCEAWINKTIVLQHLYSPAMWSVFQMQDLLGIHEKIRRNSPAEERINIPANPKHYWQYRMHISLEDLMQMNDFNEELSSYIRDAGR